MKITVEDKYSSAAVPNRGYHDYECVVSFGPDSTGSWITEEGQEDYMRVLWGLINSKSQGATSWCYPWKRVSGDGHSQHAVYSFHHGYDSGD